MSLVQYSWASSSISAGISSTRMSLLQLVVVDVGIHLHQVDDALEGILGADGELDGTALHLGRSWIMLGTL